MRYVISAGHTASGTGCGAVGYFKESTENRNVKNELIRLLKVNGKTYVDCTIDESMSGSDLLKQVVNKHNKVLDGIDIQIHFNASDGKGHGVECIYYGSNKVVKTMCDNVCSEISKIGFKNRGTKVNKKLYFLNQTKKGAMIIECCFCDNINDFRLLNTKQIALSIYNALIK